MSTPIPTEVLSPALADRIGGRRVRAAVFTTFTFDPGFFELHVLPLLFDQSFSQMDTVRLAQLEDALRGVENLAVYYDRGALSQDATPARLDYRRIDVRRRTGVFHPKLVMALVENPKVDDVDQNRSLVVAVLSANLTRAGWWENVECAHIEEICGGADERARCSFRSDLLALILRIRRSAPDDEDHGALDAIHRFLRDEAPKRVYEYASADGHFHTRLFGGRGEENLSAWLKNLGLSRREWNLEVISPFFDPSGAGPLEALIESLTPTQVRVLLPTDVDGSALVTKETYAAVNELDAKWAALPRPIVQRGKGEGGEALAPRRLHAKVYRLFHRDGRQVIVTGSVNLTGAGHSHGGAGNLEAAFLVDANDGKRPRWWLEPVEVEATEFVERAPGEDEGLEPVPVDLTLRFDWREERLEYRFSDDAPGPFEITDLSGKTLFRVETPKRDAWVRCDESAALAVKEHLRASSFVRIVHASGAWRVLIREEHMAHRPSILRDLTPEEILEYWSLLTPEQRAAFIEQHVEIGQMLEGIPATARSRLARGNTLFDRFAGIYHAFGCAYRHVKEAIEEERFDEAEARLFGAKYDSLPVLLERTLETEAADPIARYVTFLSAEQLRRRVRRTYGDFWRERRAGARHLDHALSSLERLRASLPFPDDEAATSFLDWFEPLFLRDLTIEDRPDADDHD